MWWDGAGAKSVCANCPAPNPPLEEEVAEALGLSVAAEPRLQ